MNCWSEKEGDERGARGREGTMSEQESRVERRERVAREGGGMLRSRGNRLPRVSEPLSFFLYLQPVSSRSPSFSVASSILSPFLCLSNTERAEAVSLPFHHSGSSSVCMCVCVYIYRYTRWCLFCSTSFPPFSFSHS